MWEECEGAPFAELSGFDECDSAGLVRRPRECLYICLLTSAEGLELGSSEDVGGAPSYSSVVAAGLRSAE